MSILNDIAAVLNSPQAQEGMRAFSQIGMPLELVQRDKENYTQRRKLDMLQQQEMQKQRQQAMAAQMVASIMKDGVIDSEKLSVLARFDPDIAMQLYEQAQKQAKQQQIAELIGAGNTNPDAIAKTGVLSGNPQLMQYANMLEDRKYRKNAWGEFINQPNGEGDNLNYQPYGDETIIGGAAPETEGDIATSDLPPIKKYPNTPSGQDSRRADEKLTIDKQKAEQEQKDTQLTKQFTIDKLQETINLTDELLKHKGFKGAVGTKIGNPAYAFGIKDTPFEGTPEAGFLSLQNQLVGKAFLDAIPQMKGFGNLSNAEGDALKQAAIAVSNATNEEDYIKAVTNFKSIQQRALDRLTGANQTSQPINNSNQSSDGWGIVE